LATSFRLTILLGKSSCFCQKSNRWKRISGLAANGSILSEPDNRITTIAANHQGDLFSQSQEAQVALQQAVSLAQEIDRTTFPPSAVSLHEEMAATSLGYLDAARAMMIWVGAPEDSKHSEMDQKLALARQLLESLEKNIWLENR
jgi:hypothetical protein